MERKIVRKIEVDHPIELKFSDGNAHDVLLYAEKEALGEVEKKKKLHDEQNKRSLSENDDDGTIELVETVEEDSDKRIKRKVETKRTVSEDPSTKSRVTKVTKTETTEVTKVYVLKTEKDIEKARQELGVSDVSRFVEVSNDNFFETKSRWSQPKIHLQHENEIVTPLDFKSYAAHEPMSSKDSIKKTKTVLSDSPKASTLESSGTVQTGDSDRQLDEHVYPVPAVRFDDLERKKVKESVKVKRKSAGDFQKHSGGLCSCARRSKSKEDKSETKVVTPALAVERKGSIRGVSAEHGKLSPALIRHVLVKNHPLVSDELKTVIRDNNMQLTNFFFDLMCKAGLYKNEKEQDRGRKVISRCMDILYYDRAKTWNDVRNQIWYENKEYTDTNSILIPTVNVIEYAFTKEPDLNILMNSPLNNDKMEAFTHAATKPIDVHSEDAESDDTGKLKILHEPMEKAAHVYHSVKRKLSVGAHSHSDVEETDDTPSRMLSQSSSAAKNISSIIDDHKPFSALRLSEKPHGRFHEPGAFYFKNELQQGNVESAVLTPEDSYQTNNLTYIIKDIEKIDNKKHDDSLKISEDSKKSKHLFHCFGNKSPKTVKPKPTKVSKTKAEHAEKKKILKSGKTADKVGLNETERAEMNEQDEASRTTVGNVEPPAIILPSIKPMEINYSAPHMNFTKSSKTAKEEPECYEIRPLIDNFTIDTTEISPTSIDVSKKVMTSNDSIIVEEESKIKSHKAALQNNDHFVTVRRSEHINVSTSGNITATDLAIKNAESLPSSSVRIKESQPAESGELKTRIQTHKGSVKKSHPLLDDMKHIGGFYKTDAEKSEHLKKGVQESKGESHVDEKGGKACLDIVERIPESVVSSDVFSHPISHIAKGMPDSFSANAIQNYPDQVGQNCTEIQKIILHHGDSKAGDKMVVEQNQEICDIIKSHKAFDRIPRLEKSSFREVSKIIDSHKDFDSSIKTVIVPLPNQESRVHAVHDKKKRSLSSPKTVHAGHSCFTCFAPKAKKSEEMGKESRKKEKRKTKSEERARQQSIKSITTTKEIKPDEIKKDDFDIAKKTVILPDIVLKPSEQFEKESQEYHKEKADKERGKETSYNDGLSPASDTKLSAPFLHGVAQPDYDDMSAARIKCTETSKPAHEKSTEQSAVASHLQTNQHHVLEAPRVHLPDLNANLDFQNTLYKPGVLLPLRSRLCQIFDNCDPSDIDRVLSETRECLDSEASTSLKSRLSSRLYPPLVETAVSTINAVYSDYRTGLISQNDVRDKLVFELEKYVEPRSSIDADTLSSDRPVEKLSTKTAKTVAGPISERQQEISKQVVISKGKCFSCATEKKVPVVLSPDCVQILENLQSLPTTRFQKTSTQIAERIGSKWKFEPQYEKELQKIVKKALTKLREGHSASLSMLRNELKNEHKKTFFLIDPVVDIIHVLSERTDFGHPVSDEVLDKVISDVKQSHMHFGPLTEGERNVVSEQLPDLVESTGRRLVAADETLTKKKKKLSRIILDAYDMLSKRQVANLNEMRCQLYRIHPKDRGLVDIIVDDIDSSLREGRFYKSQSVRILINIIHTKDIESCLIQNGSRGDSLLTERAYTNLRTNRSQIIRSISKVIRENAADSVKSDSGDLEQIIDEALNNLDSCSSFENLFEILSNQYPNRSLLLETLCNTIEQCYFASEFENVDQHEIIALMKDRIAGKPLVLREICFTLPAHTEIKTGSTGDFDAGKIVHIGRGLSWREANERARILFYKGRQSTVRYNDSLDGFDVKMLLEQNGVVQEVPVSKEDVRRLLNSCGLYWDGLNISLLGKSDEILRKAEQEAFKILKDSGFLYEHDPNKTS